MDIVTSARQRHGEAAGDRLGGTDNLLAFIGHFQGRPGEWFLVWADDKDTALEIVREDLDEPDEASVHQVAGAGYFLFRAGASTSASGVVELEAPPGEYVVLRDPAAEEWITRRLAAQGEVRARRKRTAPRDPRD